MRDDIYANCAGLMKYSLHSLPIFLSLSIDPSLSLSLAMHVTHNTDEEKFYFWEKEANIELDVVNDGPN